MTTFKTHIGLDGDESETEHEITVGYDFFPGEEDTDTHEAIDICSIVPTLRPKEDWAARTGSPLTKEDKDRIKDECWENLRSGDEESNEREYKARMNDRDSALAENAREFAEDR